MLFVSFPICSGGFSNVFLIAVKPVTSIPVYYTTSALYGVFVLSDTRMLLIVLLPLKYMLMLYLPHIISMLL